MVKFKDFSRFFQGLWGFFKVWPAEDKTAIEQRNCSRDDKKQQSNNLFAANRDQVILPNLLTENLRIFIQNEKSPFFKESQALTKNFQNSRNSRISGWRKNPENYQEI